MKDVKDAREMVRVKSLEIQFQIFFIYSTVKIGGNFVKYVHSIKLQMN